MWQQVPPALSDVAQQRESQFTDLAFTPSNQLIKTLCFSDYVADSLLHNEWLRDLVERFDQPIAEPEFVAELQHTLSKCTDDTQLHSALRRFRRQHQCRIIHRDVNQLAPLKETLRDLTLMADTCIQLTLNWHYQKLSARYGQTRGRRIKPVL